MANRTIATGLTDSNSNFTISPTGFTPVDQAIYVLEVVKRLGGVNNDLISLRTFLKWDQTANK